MIVRAGAWIFAGVLFCGTAQAEQAPAETVSVQASAVAASPAAQPVPSAPIPFKRDGGSGPSIGGSALGIVLVSLLAIAAVLVLRKRVGMGGGVGVFPGNGEKKLLRILETERMGPSARLSVVEFDGVRYLIGQSEHGMVHLASSPLRSEP